MERELSFIMPAMRDGALPVCHCHAVLRSCKSRPRIPNSETVAETIPDAGNLVPTFHICFRLFSSFSPGKSATAQFKQMSETTKDNRVIYQFSCALVYTYTNLYLFLLLKRVTFSSNFFIWSILCHRYVDSSPFHLRVGQTLRSRLDHVYLY